MSDRIRIGLGTALLVAGVAFASAADLPVGASVEINGHAAHPTRLLARMRVTPGADARTYAATLAQNDSTVLRTVPLVPGLVVLDEMPAATAAAAGATAPSVDPTGQARRLQARLKALRRSGLFAYVEPDYILSIDGEPDDARFADGTLWGLHNTGRDGGVAGIDVDAVRAWDLTTGSTDVIVAVVDTGINYTHAELRDQMWHNPGEIPGNGVDDDGNGIVDDVFGLNAVTGSGDPRDDHNHGSHVAGTIGAGANDGSPIVGVAWQVRLMACKFITAGGYGYSSDAIECIDYAAAHGARILNASWGGGGFNQALFDSIKAAGERGVLFVAAAGNSGTDQESEIGLTYRAYPAGFELDAIVSVAALDRAGELAWFSNYGERSVDLGAPGVQILSSLGGWPKLGYGTYSGTSMAAPHVCGVAALALAAHPTLQVGELKNLLLRSATPTASLLGKTITGGRANAFGAVAAAPDSALEVTLSLPEGQRVFRAREVSVLAHVSDLLAVKTATVTGTISGGSGALVFHDDGVAPDATAGDGTYAAWLMAPATGESVTLAVRAEAPGYVGAEASVTVPVGTFPANDRFGDATPLTGATAHVLGTNVGASKEPGEPNHAGDPGAASVWWTWTAPADGEVRLKTDSLIDTLLAVYTGSDVASLTVVVSNDDTPAGFLWSSGAFTATAGTKYQIAVDGWGGAAGEFALDLATAVPPANDQFASRLPLTGAEISTTGSTWGATNEPGLLRDDAPGGSVWWEWTAPASGTATFTIRETENGLNHLEVFTGDTPATLVLVPDLGAGGSSAGWRRSIFHATAGTRYQVTVRSMALVGGAFELHASLVDPPANDAFAQRVVVTGENFRFDVATRGATREPGEPDLGEPSTAGTSVWYAWTAPCDGTVLLNAGGDFLAAMAAYSGDSLATLQRVARSDHGAFPYYFSGLDSQLTFAVRTGETYAIVVDTGAGDPGTVEVVLKVFDPPANDRFANRARLDGDAIRITATKRGAASEPGEPRSRDGAEPAASVWWTWTAPRAGRAVFDVQSGGIISSVQLFTGGAIDTLTAVEAPVDRFDRHLFNVEAGVTYQISIGDDPRYLFPYGRHNDVWAQGDFILDLALLDPPANESFARRTVIAGTNATITASNRAAILDPAEILVGYRLYFAPLWWSWTAPADGKLNLSTIGSSNPMVMQVFTGAEWGALTGIASGIDDPLGQAGQPVTINAAAGTTYHIAIDSLTGEIGDFVWQLAFAPSPPNDAFANAAPLTGASAKALANNRGATAQPGEPAPALVPPDSSLWWSWTAPADGEFVGTTLGSDFDTVLGVYTGATLDALRVVAVNDDMPRAGTFSRVGFTAQQGVTYHLVVDGFGGASGAIVLNLLPAQVYDVAVALTAPLGVAAGGALTLRATGSGAGPLFYQWRHDGLPVPGATEATYVLPSAQRFHAGAYSVVVSNLTGSVVSGSWTVAVTPPPSSPARLVNVSTRGYTLSGDAQLIPGFVIGGTGTKRVLLRAVGPTLLAPPIDFPGTVMPDPQLTLQRFDATTNAYQTVTTNDDWIDNTNAVEVALTTERLSAFGLTADEDAALLLDLPPGQYTVFAGDTAGRAGVGIVELYDADETTVPTARLINISNRGFAGAGDQVMIPGFVISSEGSKTLLIRVVGPMLAYGFGIPGAMADPMLTVFQTDPVDGGSTAILTQDNWADNPDAGYTAQIAEKVGAFPLYAGIPDAAFVVTLPPGVYTVVGESAAAGGTGVVLVEVYEVP